MLIFIYVFFVFRQAVLQREEVVNLKIAYIDFLYDGSWTFEDVVYEMRKHCDMGVAIDYYYVTGVSNLEYISFHTVVEQKILTEINDIRKKGYDAVIIGCFMDPAIDAAKELFHDIIIIGPGEASVLIASQLGKSFSILCGRRKWFDEAGKVVSRVGLKSRLASLRSLDITVEEMHTKKEYLHHRMEEEIASAIYDDGAEAIVLGCTMELGQYRSLQEKFKVPVIDPTIAALMQAQMLWQCRKNCDWMHSGQCTWEQPPAEEVKKFLGFSL